MQIYVVRSGDYVNTIAQRFGVSIQQLIYDNQLEPPYHLAVGQALLIQNGINGNDRQIVSSGYAYPFIDPAVLQQTLPYLSQLRVFSYGFDENGELVFPALDDKWMIQQAEYYGVIPVLTVAPLGPDGRFNSELVSIVSNEPMVQQNLTRQLIQVMQEKGYRGLDIDFEYVLAEDRILFADFVRNITAVMNSLGYQVSVALAPKTSREQRGVLYEGKDYALLGAAANAVLLMTYEWGYTYGPPMAVAPIHMVKRVVDYAVTEIPREKIDLGIPNYGYDWPLPYVSGETQARSIGNAEAVQIAVEQGAEIQFDETAQSPYFRYQESGVEHEVWFEDVRSIQAKFELIQEYGLRGAGYWQIMKLFRANWLLLEDVFQIRKF